MPAKILKTVKRSRTGRRFMNDLKNFRNNDIKGMTMFQIKQYRPRAGGGSSIVVESIYHEVIAGRHETYPLEQKEHFTYKKIDESIW